VFLDDLDVDRSALSGPEARALGRMAAVAWLLDDAIRVPGTGRRIGLDPVVGVLPVAGDLATAAISLYIVAEAALAGVSRRTLAAMLANVAIDAGAGSVPVVGDLFDAGWKANRRNVELAARDLAEAP
jgi:hypothetical protein